MYWCLKPQADTKSTLQTHTQHTHSYLEVANLILQSLVFTLQVSEAMLSLTKLRLQLSLQLPAPFLELLQLLLRILATAWNKHRLINNDLSNSSDSAELNRWAGCRADWLDDPGHRL